MTDIVNPEYQGLIILRSLQSWRLPPVCSEAPSQREPPFAAARSTHANWHQAVNRRCRYRPHEWRQSDVQLPLEFGRAGSQLVRLLPRRANSTSRPISDIYSFEFVAAKQPLVLELARRSTRPRLHGNATGPAQVKYDFDSLVVSSGPGGMPPSIFTFGGDREASFIAPDPVLVDDEVWRFSQPWPK